jgi:hypothetical protein
MNNYRLSTYDLPGLSDMGTLRVPVENAPVAQNWLQGQGARLIGSSPVRGSNEQVIRFEDPSYQGIINRLRQKAPVQETVFYEPDYASSPAVEGFTKITPEGYTSLHSLKAKGNPKDFIDKLQMGLHRTGQSGELIYNPNQYEQLISAHEKAGVPIEYLEQNELNRVLGDTIQFEEIDPAEIAKANIRSHYAMDSGLSGKGKLLLVKPYENLDRQAREVTPALVKTFRNILVNDEDNTVTSKFLPDRNDYRNKTYHGNYFSPQFQAGGYVLENPYETVIESPQHISDIHNAATEFEINKRLFQSDPKMQAIAFEQTRNAIANVPMPRGGWGKGTSPLEYIAQPEFRNQIRTAGRFAGSLFA